MVSEASIIQWYTYWFPQPLLYSDKLKKVSEASLAQQYTQWCPRHLWTMIIFSEAQKVPMSLIPSQPSDPLKVSQHWYLAIILHGCYKTHNANRFSKILNAIQMNSINHPVTAAIKCFRSTHYVMLFYNLQWSQPVNQNSPPILSPTQQLTLFGMSTNFWLQKTTPDSIFPNIIVPMSCTPEERGVKTQPVSVSILTIILMHS